MDANAILKPIAGSPLDLANAGAYFVQEGLATAKLLAGVLAQSVPTDRGYVRHGRRCTVGK